ncbi:hypothetical protein [Nonomuraea typhae]|uniref:hypothetical protein n=1 Tax=Nonomuraea typhae TaxID=2603600 RepID=UPI0012F9D2BF|nr:hypothetical protein [Nonomuraea typhae]
MPRYRVIGPCEVAGVQPGGVITEFPAGVNVEALIQGGHIEPTEDKPAEAKQAAKPRGGTQ